MTFIDHIKRAREAAGAATQRTGPEHKDPVAMSDAERDEEIKRLEWEKTKREIKAIYYGREQLGGYREARGCA